MTGMTHLKVRPEHLRGAANISERRQYRRHDITLLGRFMWRLTREELTCRLLDLSIGGASMMAEKLPQMGENIILYLEEFGGLEGKVIRIGQGSFAMSFSASHRRRQKLAAQMTWLLNRHELPTADQRRSGHERISLPEKPVKVALADGTLADRRLLDVSISGASIATSDKPEIGSEIVVGRLPARVVRHHARGIGVEFKQVQNLGSNWKQASFHIVSSSIVEMRPHNFLNSVQHGRGLRACCVLCQ